jgi:hypothetical protein
MNRFDRERIVSVLVAVGAVFAVLSVILGGVALFPSGSETLDWITSVVARSLPVIGLALIAGVLWFTMRTDDDTVDDTFGARRVETVEIGGRDPVGKNLERHISVAAEDRYDCKAGYSAEQIGNLLTESAVRAVQTGGGLDTQRAASAVREGTWTDDRVAAAFLTPKVGQPLSERFRGMVDPGQAYRRRLERTLDAIEAWETGQMSRDANATSGEATSDGDGTEATDEDSAAEPRGHERELEPATGDSEDEVSRERGASTSHTREVTRE